jgi:diguanylate cyclase (GGDEF)-like protein
MRRPSGNILLFAFAVVAMSAAVWAVVQLQRDTLTTSFAQTEAAEGILTAALDQETSLRGFMQTGREDFLEPYRDGELRLAQAVAESRRLASGDDRGLNRLVDRAERIALAWEGDADGAIARVRSNGVRRVPVAEALRRKAMMDQLRATVARLHAHVERDRTATVSRTSNLSVAIIVGLSLLFAIGGWLAIGRPAARRDRRDHEDAVRRERQADFARTLQFMDSEEETHELVRRHLERHIAGSEVVVLQRNNSADRLEATTQLREGHQLPEALIGADPRACLAVRLGRQVSASADDLLRCELCGKTEAELTTCTPLLVSGEVIGSVLVAHDRLLDAAGSAFVDDTVTQAAPVVANLRNLAIAEQRAATDPLTGLANRRSVQDTLRRMLAQAARSEASLAAIALDLDHFKRINDRFGHDTGDDVLAATAQALKGTLRTSDFVGRQGGEEFIVLLPDTGLDGALVAAENLRRSIARLEIPGLDLPVTASFGVAVYPEDAVDPGLLLRHADRALYAAKEAGRNRVEAAAGSPAQPGTAPGAPSPQTAG